MKIALALSALAASLVLGGPSAQAADDYSPNARCNLARPGTPTGEWCEDRGWTIRTKLTVDSRGVLRNLTLRRCDSILDRDTCYVLGRDGNHGFARYGDKAVRFNLPRV